MLRTGSAALALLLAAAPSHAQQTVPQQQTPAPDPAPRAITPEEEIVITGRKRDTPSYQEQYEFHKAEYERLRQKFERVEAPRYSPAERKLRAPELLTGTLPGKPTITERLD